MRAGTLALALLLVVASALRVFGGNIADPDLWGHLRYGEMVLRGDGLPRADVFSYTAPGAPFYNHEWLSDVVFAALYGVGGSAALLLFKLLACVVILLATLDSSRSLGERLAASNERAHPLVVGAVMIVALAAIAPGATLRPQLFTMTFLAVELALILRGDRRMRTSATLLPLELAVLPVLLLVWANAHGGFLVGLGLLGMYGVATFAEASLAVLRRRALPLARGQLVALVIVLALAVLAPLVNPYGVELYVYLGNTLDMHDEISEWRPVRLLASGYLPFKVLCIAFLGMVVARARHRDDRRGLEVLAWLGPFLAIAAIAGFRHQRHTVLFAIALAPLLVVGAEGARRRVAERWPDGLRMRAAGGVAACGAILVALLQIQAFAAQLGRDGMAIRFGRLDYPLDAVEFLRTHDIQGNLAVPFEWGAYTISKLAPDSRVFIDGRFEAVYPKQVIDDYFAFMHGTEGWERLLDAYPTDVVVVQRWRNIHPRLFTHPDFAYVYSDPAALVFVRRSPENDQALARLSSLDRTDFPRHPTVFP